LEGWGLRRLGIRRQTTGEAELLRGGHPEDSRGALPMTCRSRTPRSGPLHIPS